MKINPNVLRKKVIDMVRDKQSGHIGGCFFNGRINKCFV